MQWSAPHRRTMLIAYLLVYYILYNPLLFALATQIIVRHITELISACKCGEWQHLYALLREAPAPRYTIRLMSIYEIYLSCAFLGVGRLVPHIHQSLYGWIFSDALAKFCNKYILCDKYVCIQHVCGASTIYIIMHACVMCMHVWWSGVSKWIECAAACLHLGACVCENSWFSACASSASTNKH